MKNKKVQVARKAPPEAVNVVETSAVSHQSSFANSGQSRVSSTRVAASSHDVDTRVEHSERISVKQLEKELMTLKQDKTYLQYKVDSLEDELKKVKVNKDEQRIRALDLKHELSEVM